MRPFFSFYGGKWRAAPHYPPPLHDTIVEPFAGSAGYALRYADRNVILVEKDPIIAGLWRWLIAASPAEILDLPLLEPGQSVDDLDVREEARWLIGFWLNKGKSRPAKTACSWLRELPNSTTFWGEAVRARVARQVPTIAHWTVLEGDYHIVPDVRATWFIDPPYQHFGKYYTHSSADIDFSALGEWCQSRSGQIIVCENVGAHWLPFQPFLQTSSAQAYRRRGGNAEAIYCRPGKHIWDLW